MELDSLTQDGKKLKDNTVETHTKESIGFPLPDSKSARDDMCSKAHHHLWYKVTVKVHSLLTKKSIENSRRYVDRTVVPLVAHYGTVSLLPDSYTLKEVFGFGSNDSGERPAHKYTAPRPGHRQHIPLSYEKNERLFERMLPLALVSASLTAFILPLYDGPTIIALRWIMTVLSVYMGPRLKDGLFPSFGVLILGFMINKPLTICTIALGAWVSYFLCIIISKSLGIYSEIWD